MYIDTGTRILIVDDFELNRLTLKKYLTDLHFKRIDEAVDGKEASEKIIRAYKSDVPYHIIFLDWNMPKMDGLELLKRFRTAKEFKDLKIIMVTGEQERDSVLAALKAGVDDYVVKPFELERIREKLQRHGFLTLDSVAKA